MDGIVGLYGSGDRELVNKAFLATGACQHRGKASTGLAVANTKGIYIHKGLGRIAEVIDPNTIKTFRDLEPQAAIGNIGYTKRRVPEKVNSEPILICPRKASSFQVAITMDGYLIRDDDLRAELEADYIFQTDNKTEVVGTLLHKYLSEEGIRFEAGERLLEALAGRATFALTAIVHDGSNAHLVALNDAKAFANPRRFAGSPPPHGTERRPLLRARAARVPPLPMVLRPCRRRRVFLPPLRLFPGPAREPHAPLPVAPPPGAHPSCFSGQRAVSWGPGTPPPTPPGTRPGPDGAPLRGTFPRDSLRWRGRIARRWFPGIAKRTAFAL